MPVLSTQERKVSHCGDSRDSYEVVCPSCGTFLIAKTLVDFRPDSKRAR